MPWTDERRERFRQTMAAKKKGASKALAQKVPREHGGGVMLTINGRAISWQDALEVHAAVEQLKRGKK